MRGTAISPYSRWTFLELSIHGTWHHDSPKHLGRHVKEPTLRLNDGNCDVNTIGRMTEIVRGVGGKLLPHRKLDAANGLSARVVPV